MSMSKLVYRVGDLRDVIAESSQGFKAIIGPNVERDNKKNNEQSYKDIQKDVASMTVTPNDKLDDSKNVTLPNRHDDNSTTLSANPLIDPSKEYKERVKSQAKGYTSTQEENNGIEKSDQYDRDGKILQGIDKNRKRLEDRKMQKIRSGLTARTMPKDRFEKFHLDEDKNVRLKPKKLKFKHTTFVNESQVLNRIPEEYKKDGQVIHMIDASDNEYIVECTYSKKADIMETHIVGHKNKHIMQEQVSRMFELMNYKSPRSMTVNEKENRDSAFSGMLKELREHE